MQIDTKLYLSELGDGGFIEYLTKTDVTLEGNRFLCPLPECATKQNKMNGAIYEVEGAWKYKCHHCGSKGSLIDLVCKLESKTFKDAIARLEEITGKPAPLNGQKSDKTKDEVLLAGPIWEKLSPYHSAGHEYLKSRNLGDALEEGFVRFAPGHNNEWYLKYMGNGFPLAMALFDVTGAIVSIQFRAIAPQPDGRKQMSLRGQSGRGGFFGNPEFIENAKNVVVCEGMADTLAAQLATRGKEGFVVVGSPGKDALHTLADSIKNVGIDIQEKTFWLMVQNDAPLNYSRKAFVKLHAKLSAMGATINYFNTPSKYDDFADYRQREPTAIVNFDSEVSTETSTPVEPGRNWTTLLALIEDPNKRAQITGVRGDLYYDELAQEPILTGKPLDEDLFIEYCAKIEQLIPSKRVVSFKKGEVYDAVVNVAKRKPINHVREYLERVKWDEQDRFAALAKAIVGRAPTDIELILIRKWMVGAAARPLNPGCKLDHILILTGPQGAGKSTFGRLLASEAFFSDSKVDIHNKDGKLALQGKWIVEWAELDSIRGREAEEVKAFLSSPVDKFRPPFARKEITVPRTGIIIGTTNDEEFLGDATGNRRFWTICVGNKIDTDYVSANRDQLWAQAVHELRQGELTYLLPAEEKLLTEIHSVHQIVDSWDEVIQEWLSNTDRKETTSKEILSEALRIEPKNQSRSEILRVTRVLTASGWKRTVVNRNGTAKRVWRKTQ